jgi:hypothetical protein
MSKFYATGLVLSGLLLISGCGSTPEPLPPPPPPKPIANVAKPPPPKPVVMTPVNPDACGAKDMQYLVGLPKSDIPVPLNPRLRRVVCSTCAMTMDYSPERQTIIFDVKTNLVTEVRCG